MPMVALRLMSPAHDFHVQDSRCKRLERGTFRVSVPGLSPICGNKDGGITGHETTGRIARRTSTTGNQDLIPILYRKHGLPSLCFLDSSKGKSKQSNFSPSNALLWKLKARQVTPSDLRPSHGRKLARIFHFKFGTHATIFTVQRGLHPPATLVVLQNSSASQIITLGTYHELSDPQLSIYSQHSSICDVYDVSRCVASRHISTLDFQQLVNLNKLDIPPSTQLKSSLIFMVRVDGPIYSKHLLMECREDEETPTFCN
jgi:hypothetical protein